MGSGIIFVVIAGLWAVILVPMWLRSHDAAAETKSVDRFSTAMRTLSRRDRPSPGSRDVLMPGRSRGVELSGGRAPSATARRARAAEQARMRRRRTVTLALVGFSAVVLLAAAAGAAPLWLPMVVIVGTGAYVVHLRIAAVNAADLERRRRRAAARTATTAARPAPRREAAPQAPTWPVAPAKPVAAPIVAADTEIVLPAGSWAPTPVVLPTYVTAPPATSVPRVIDLTHPGSWSAAHMLDQAAAMGMPDPDEIFDGRALPDPNVAPTGQDLDDAPFDQTAFEHETVAATVAGSTARPFLEDDAVFDQDDEDTLLAFLDRRASGD